MLVSHEIPIDTLEESRSFNDYDYCLIHLTYKYKEYKDYYINSIKSGRKVLLDNSIYELSEPVTLEQLAEGVREIKPTWYIVPDCLDNTDVTISRFNDFCNKYNDLPGSKIGVVQGSTLDDLIRCYKYMSNHADKIAFSFDSKAYFELIDSNDRLEVCCEGRKAFIKYLVDNNIWNSNKPHHLLGCSYAREFLYTLYKEISIESVDTSNPVVAAIKGLTYSDNGLNEKPSIKLCDLIDYKLTEDDKKRLHINVNTFRKICN